MIKKLLSYFVFYCFPISAMASWEFIDKKGNHVLFENAQESDLKEQEEVFIAAFMEAYRDFSIEDLGIQDKYTFLKDAFADVYEDFKQGSQRLISAKSDGRVVGFAGFKETEKPHQIYITQLAVAPEYWRNGIGRELVFSVFHCFSDADHLVVIPRRINAVAKKFYSQLGFVECSYMHPGYNPQKYIGYEWIKKN